MISAATPRTGRRRARIVLDYLLLLALSHGVSAWRERALQPSRGLPTATIIEKDDRGRAKPVSIAYVDWPGATPDAPVVLLLHGSPARSFDLRSLAETLKGPFRLIVPDLPGFGRSSRRVGDYSIRAQAERVHALLDTLHIERAHVVGFSLGGGVALYLQARAPDRVASLTLLASIGVQELELLGSYTLNRALYGAQLAALWFAENVLPHFGLLDRALFNVPYARSFYDTDQRPLRGILERCEAPMLIVHGREDPLVPVAAALEHHRIVPQSELVLLDGAHFHVYTDPAAAAAPIREFIERVERGEALARSDASHERVAAAAEPFDRIPREPAVGVALLVVIALIAIGTLISEDLACIGAGLLVAHGLLGYTHAALAAFVGIFVGDILLYQAGRYIGRPALHRAPFRWFIRPQAIQDSADWFARRGPIVILASRFVPGSRLPTYFTAGLLHQNFWLYLLFFFVAGAVWAPFLVWLAATLGDRALDVLREYKMYTLGALVVILIAIWAVWELLIPLCTLRGRRLLYGRRQRLLRSEFWPAWALYGPLLPWFAWLAVRYRGLTTFTAANPAMPAGGLVGESKSEILGALARHAEAQIARFVLLPAGITADEALARARDFQRGLERTFPIVLKPDVGERGIGIEIAETEYAIRRYFKTPRPATMLQEYVPGREYGVFYVRHPANAAGAIFAVTEKEFPVLIGDGRHTLEQLILRDPRAVCMARFHLHAHLERLSWVPQAGERFPLARLGNHCRGAIFRDGARLITPELTAAIDTVSRGYTGFYFGRYDLRAPDENALRAGRDFKIIELNGVLSEATNLYDPKYRAIDRWRILARQWQLACEIGAHNRAAGARAATLGEVLDLLARHRAALDASEPD
jgi:pimeloyl-ACP methyl ester carboxylesterase/membrane protein DedA with SNARE-associated domain